MALGPTLPYSRTGTSLSSPPLSPHAICYCGSPRPCSSQNMGVIMQLKAGNSAESLREE